MKFTVVPIGSVQFGPRSITLSPRVEIRASSKAPWLWAYAFAGLVIGDGHAEWDVASGLGTEVERGVYAGLRWQY